MSGQPDWSERFDEDLANEMLRLSQAPEGNVGGIPGFLGIRFTAVEPGVCVAEIDVAEHLLNPFGAAHGAVMASLVDHVLGSAVFPLVPLGTWPATLEFKLNYVAPTRPGVLRAMSRVLSLSKRTAVVAVDCHNDGRLVGTAVGTLALTPPRDPSSPAGDTAAVEY
ncbi:MAG: PaaI family thioesterase [Microthrixaceae bacterium]